MSRRRQMLAGTSAGAWAVIDALEAPVTGNVDPGPSYSFSLESLVGALAAGSPHPLALRLELSRQDMDALTRAWQANNKDHGRNIGLVLTAFMGLPIVDREGFAPGYGEIVNSDGTRLPVRFGPGR